MEYFYNMAYRTVKNIVTGSESKDRILDSMADATAL